MSYNLAIILISHNLVKMKISNALKHVTSKKGVAFLCIASAYIMMVNMNFQQRSRLLQDQNEMLRDLQTIDLGDGDCTIDPLADGNPAPANATKTLLTSYPGSGTYICS